MADTVTDVLVAGYQGIDEATTDFDALADLVARKQVALQGAILVTHATDGTVNVRQTADHRGRQGVAWGGGVGLAVGLAAPPLLAATAVGAAAGGLIGKFVDHRLEAGIHDKIGENLPPGSAGIIVVFDDEEKLAVEQALPGSLAKSVVQTDKKGTQALQQGLAEAMGKFVPDRTVLPIPDRAFGGTAGRTFDRSVGDWTIIPGPKAPENSPNVLLILIDDAGFGSADTFGGGIATPNLTRVAEMGLRYNSFHVTAVCSPTRAAMLTGRNHHRVGMGTIAELPGPYPGYTGVRPRNCTALPRILRENGYVTAGFGKWHLTPGSQMGAAGPFDHWPLSWGFDHWYGFLTGAAGQYDPLITQDNTTTGVPEAAEGDYYFPDDFTDKSIEWFHAVRAADAQKPWMMYYSTGCAHAPHHVAKEWADRYKGKFDQGWDAYREETLARQKKLGIVPEDAELTERPDLFPAWDSLSDAEKKLYARQMEVAAGFQENADWNIGRLLDAIEEAGRARQHPDHLHLGRQRRQHGGHAHRLLQRDDLLQRARSRRRRAAGADREVGRHRRAGRVPHRSPLRRGLGSRQQHAVPVGKADRKPPRGTRDPMVIAWPNRIKARGELRTQFTHCIDVVPTVLELVGIPEPKAVDGIEQEPMDGTSFAYTLDEPAAAERHTVQYFEMLGSRAIYKDGWWACAKLDKLPWDFTPATMQRFAPGEYDPDQDKWELYYLPDDFSQAKNLAAEQPAKLAELKELFWEEAERNRVLPLLGGVLGLHRRHAAAADDHPIHLRRRRAKRADDDDPPHLSGARTPSRRTRMSPREVPRACSSPSPTSSAGSRSGSTTRACSTTPTSTSA